ncbi:MAG: chemotaxis response regulator protein-glutamate methylesterase [Clostridiales bacterium]
MRNSEKKINVLVVDDSAFMRKVVADLLNSDNEIKVVGTARDGKEAIKKFKELKPDVVTMDVEMPVMNGLVCIKEILKISYIPIVMISSHTKTGTDYTIEALENGAVDFVSKPENILEMKGNIIRNELVEKIKMSFNVKEEIVKDKKEEVAKNEYEKENIDTKKILEPKRIDKKPIKVKNNSKIRKNNNDTKMHIIAIGTSTGGPKALQTVISKLPKDLPITVVVVQHMPPKFTSSLAERLNNCSELSVKEAEDGDVLNIGNVYIAPGDFHMLVENHISELKIKLTKDPPIGRLRPAVDVLYQSLSDTGLNNISSIIMTGMGSDGSEGVKKLKELNGAYTIAQDEKSCTVFGMPKMAIQTGFVDKVIPLESIASEIIKIAGGDI